jgi:hypothetical protein
VPQEPDATDRALELFVYGPVGLALYLRDTAPSFLKLFVARGRAVLDEQRKSVEGQLGQARAVGEFATTYGGPQVRRFVNDGLTKAWSAAEEALEALGTLTGTSPHVSGVPPAAGTEAPAASPATPPPPAGATRGAPALAIPDYDELSASHVVDRLEGLPRGDLDSIRAYETSHRARNTVLGKIEQLTRPDA